MQPQTLLKKVKLIDSKEEGFVLTSDYYKIIEAQKPATDWKQVDKILFTEAQKNRRNNTGIINWDLPDLITRYPEHKETLGRVLACGKNTVIEFVFFKQLQDNSILPVNRAMLFNIPFIEPPEEDFVFYDFKSVVIKDPYKELKLSKEELILDTVARKEMTAWNIKHFKATHHTLYKVIIEAIKANS